MDEETTPPNPWTRLEAAGEVLSRFRLLFELQRHHDAEPNWQVMSTILGVLSDQLDVALTGSLAAVQRMTDELDTLSTWGRTADDALWADPL